MRMKGVLAVISVGRCCCCWVEISPDGGVSVFVDEVVGIEGFECVLESACEKGQWGDGREVVEMLLCVLVSTGEMSLWGLSLLEETGRIPFAFVVAAGEMGETIYSSYPRS